MAVGGRYTGLDHDHVLFCGGAGRRRKRGGDSSSTSEEEDKGRHEERGFGSESDPDARGKGLCEREEASAAVVADSGGNKAFGKEGGSKEGGENAIDVQLYNYSSIQNVHAGSLHAKSTPSEGQALPQQVQDGADRQPGLKGERRRRRRSRGEGGNGLAVAIDPATGRKGQTHVPGLKKATL